MKEGINQRTKRPAWCLVCNRHYYVKLINKGNHWCMLEDIPRHYQNKGKRKE